jgi:hypothetical protein
MRLSRANFPEFRVPISLFLLEYMLRTRHCTVPKKMSIAEEGVNKNDEPTG